MFDKVSEIFSPSGKYKAVIKEKVEGYYIDVFTLMEDIDFESGQSYGEYWSRRNDRVIVYSKEFKAEFVALEEIRNIMGEPDSPLTIEWVRDFSFCSDAKFLNPRLVKVFYDSSDSSKQESFMQTIEARTIIDFSGLCLIEEIDNEDNWLMGQIEEDGNIYCWGYYGSLKQAIRGL
ncbi:MAG: hypothetical protein N2645_04870 [Clostridia bacterium]|nr:hypothetical protein [Clostridia bacterium]